MKNNLLIISALLVMLIMPIANGECIYPKKNFNIPNGSKATEAAMVEAQTAIKAYQTDLGSYRDCLDEELARIPKEVENYDEISKVSLKKFNAAVDAETQLAEDWGTAVRAYKAQ
jgi:hypothetical protein